MICMTGRTFADDRWYKIIYDHCTHIDYKNFDRESFAHRIAVVQCIHVSHNQTITNRFHDIHFCFCTINSNDYIDWQLCHNSYAQRSNNRNRSKGSYHAVWNLPADRPPTTICAVHTPTTLSQTYYYIILL